MNMMTVYGQFTVNEIATKSYVTDKIATSTDSESAERDVHFSLEQWIKVRGYGTGC